MPSAKSGQAGSLVAPAAPEAAEEADQADPGQVEKIKAEQRKTQTGKYGAVKTEPFKPAAGGEGSESKTSWIEVEMVGEDGKPRPGERYQITLPDGTVATGTLDEKGVGRVEGFEPGSCKITFPDLDKDAWEPA